MIILLKLGTATGRDSRSVTRPRPKGVDQLYAYPVKRDTRDPYFHLPTVSTRTNRYSTLNLVLTSAPTELEEGVVSTADTNK